MLRKQLYILVRTIASNTHVCCGLVILRVSLRLQYPVYSPICDLPKASSTYQVEKSTRKTHTCNFLTHITLSSLLRISWEKTFNLFSLYFDVTTLNPHHKTKGKQWEKIPHYLSKQYRTRPCHSLHLLIPKCDLRKVKQKEKRRRKRSIDTTMD